MGTLNEVLERMRPILTAQPQKPHTQLPGSISEGGSLTTFPSKKTMENPSLQPQAKPSTAKPSASRQASYHSQQDKAKLTLALGQVCELQKQYGKTAANLETLVSGFLWLLAGIPMQEILTAMKSYVLAKNDIPTPSDLLNIIDPPKQEWKPDWAAYIAMKKRIQEHGYYPYGDEREFLRRCEQYAVDRALKPDRDEAEMQAHGVAKGIITFSGDMQ